GAGQRDSLLVGETDDRPVRAAFDQEVRAPDRGYVVDRGVAVEGAADAFGRPARILGRLVDSADDRPVLDESGDGRHQHDHDDRDHDGHDDQVDEPEAALAAAARWLAGGCCHWKVPIRLMSPKFIQMKNASPTMFASGTKPQYRLSRLFSRLSPITK